MSRYDTRGGIADLIDSQRPGAPLPTQPRLPTTTYPVQQTASEKPGGAMQSFQQGQKARDVIEKWRAQRPQQPKQQQNGPGTPQDPTSNPQPGTGEQPGSPIQEIQPAPNNGPVTSEPLPDLTPSPGAPTAPVQAPPTTATPITGPGPASAPVEPGITAGADPGIVSVGGSDLAGADGLASVGTGADGLAGVGAGADGLAGVGAVGEGATALGAGAEGLGAVGAGAEGVMAAGAGAEALGAVGAGAGAVAGAADMGVMIGAVAEAAPWLAALACLAKDGGRIGFAQGGIADQPKMPFGHKGAGSNGGLSHLSQPGGGLFRGAVRGATPGRADSRMGTVGRGSYVVPADVVSSMGGGNTDAGHSALQTVLAKRGPIAYARGGQVGGQAVPVRLSDGEFVYGPEEVAHFGGGDRNKGAAALDNLVHTVRRHTASKLTRMPPPR